MFKMTAALRVVAKEKQIADIWAGSTKMTLYKGKGYALECTQYRDL